MKNKKKLNIIMIILIVLSTIGIIVVVSRHSNRVHNVKKEEVVNESPVAEANDIIVNDIYDKYPSDVDGGISELMSMEKFKKLSIATKRELVSFLLERYVEAKLINHLVFDEKKKVFTCEYAIGEFMGKSLKVNLKNGKIVHK